MRQSLTMLEGVNSSARSNYFVFIITITLFLNFIFFVPLAHSSKIVELTIKGPIGPATADYINRGISEAQNVDLILIKLDTPGGLDESTRLIVQKFLSSAVPIVTYVSPTGARAASAGTYLLYASTLAAMAPGTQLGAASPVNIGAGFGEGKDAKQPSTMDKKVKNDAVATIRSLAQLRGRDPVFAQKAVEEATTLTSAEALKNNVINYIAKDDMDLLTQMNGVTVTQNNKQMRIDTSKPEKRMVSPDWRTQFLSVITNPTVAYLLILLGIYGIFFELMNPGFVLPGVVGAVAMIIALYALQLLPINYAGLGLIVLGILFIIAEGFTPSFGALGVGGTVAFILGSIMLMDTDFAAYQIAWSAIWGMAAVNIIIFIALLGMAYRARNQKIQNGLVLLVGAKGRAIGEINLDGQAIIRGEIWQVHAKNPIANDRSVKVLKTKGILLEVEEDFD